MLTIAKPAARPREWPEQPYKGLSYYEPDDAPLFAGRKGDVVKCAELLTRPATRILFLHGPTGCGKSSFLRAGLIPFLEEEDIGIGFLKDARGERLKSIFVRATGKPLVELAKKVCDFARTDILIKSPLGETYPLGLPDTLGGLGEAEFIERASGEPEFLIERLGEIAERLPKSLVLIVDQGEEVFTLKPDKQEGGSQYRYGRHARNFFRFLDLFSRSRFDLKLLIALRTEYYGRFCGKMQQTQVFSPNVVQYMLDNLSKEQIVEAIRLPTSETNEGFGAPYKHYHFEYEGGLPEIIADELLSKKLAGGILPVMQVVCDTLYKTTKAAQGTSKPWKISEGVYRSLGSIEDQVEKSLDATFGQLCKKNGITSDADVQKETERWKDLLSELAGSQSDGTVTTDVKSEEELKAIAEKSRCRLDFVKTMRHLADDKVRVLRYTEFVDTRNACVLRYSLGHDAIGLVLHRWKVTRKEVADSVAIMRSRLRVGGWVLMVLGLLLVILALKLKYAGWDDQWAWFISLMLGIYGFTLVAVSYMPRPTLFNQFFYWVVVAYLPFIPKKSLERMIQQREFQSLLRLNPHLLAQVQKRLG